MSSSFRVCALRSAIQSRTREDGEVDRDLPRLAEVRLDRRLADRAGDRRRDRRHEDEPGDLLVGRLRSPAAPTERNQATDEPHDVVPEVDDHGDERPEMQGDVERLVEVRVRPRGSASPRARGRGSGAPDEEIGRSSVKPWTIPSVKACQSVSFPACSPTPSAASTTATTSRMTAIVYVRRRGMTATY